MRRLNRAAAQHYSVGTERHRTLWADRVDTRRGGTRETQAQRPRLRQQRQIRSPQRRNQKTSAGSDAYAVDDVERNGAEARNRLGPTIIEIDNPFEPGLLGGGDESFSGTGNFVGTAHQDGAAIAMGGYVSLSGILTFPKSTELRDIARDIPADRLLVETDAPYLAPVPFRGKRNEPAYVAHTAKVLAAIRHLEAEALADLTTENFRRLFRKAA